jgi:hypothetical protein
MAIYKIFPEKDATLYSQYSGSNTGLDEILELSTIVDDQTVYSSRPVLKFSQTEIDDIISNLLTSNIFLLLFVALFFYLPLINIYIHISLYYLHILLCYYTLT